MKLLLGKSDRRRFLFLMLIMVGVCLVAMLIMTLMLYRHNIEIHREQLQATVQSQARLIEAIARYDAMASGMPPDGIPSHEAVLTTLAQVTEAHERYEGIGKTGEFTLARRDGDSIVFILRHRHGSVDQPTPVDFGSRLAEPMRRALKGLSGTVIGPDYRGETVLAAHEPVDVLGLGIVAKIDLQEIRSPFIRSGLVAAAFAVIVIIAGSLLFFRVGNPIISRLEAHAKGLEKEIREHTLAEQALKESREEFHGMVMNLGIGFYRATLDGKLLVYNTEFKKILGLDLEPDWTGIELPDFWQDPQDRKDYVQEFMTSGFIKDYIVNVVKVGGEKIVVQLHARLIKDESGNPSIIEGTFLDVTELRRAEEKRETLIREMEDQVEQRTVELAKRVKEAESLNRAMVNLLQDLRAGSRKLEVAHNKLEASNKELDSFSYSVSHDLRAPLRAVDGYVRILEEDYGAELDDEGKRICSMISGNARQMGTLIDDLLRFSRLGRAELSIGRVDMTSIAKATFEELAMPGERKRIDFNLGHLPPMRGDSALISQVWRNLLGNAIKFSSKKKRAVIEVQGEETAEETVYSVRDNGSGFDMRYADKLFGVFQRLHSRREFEGTGVGLAIVQRVVRRHGGRVWAEAEVEKGASIHFAFPREIDDEQ